MKTRGFDKPLFLLPFDHSGSFKTGMFGWKAVAAGANVLVAGTAIFGESEGVAEAMNRLHQAFFSRESTETRNVLV